MDSIQELLDFLMGKKALQKAAGTETPGIKPMPGINPTPTPTPMSRQNPMSGLGINPRINNQEMNPLQGYVQEQIKRQQLIREAMEKELEQDKMKKELEMKDLINKKKRKKSSK